MSERVRISSLNELPEGKGLLVEALGHRIAVFRVGEEVHAIGDRCSHAEASLAEGELFGLDVECPRHGSEFNITTGEPGSFPATRAVPVYEVEITDGEVFMTLEPQEEE